MIGAENVKFEASDVDAGDPGKLKYLHAGRPGYPEWQAKPFSQVSRVDSRACPGCMFPDAPPGKWPHTKDVRCRLFPLDVVTKLFRDGAATVNAEGGLE
jgi:hypothetical protein